jgi:copper chaperone
MKTYTFSVNGMNDQADTEKVNQALHDVWGIRKAEVNLNTGEATFSFDEKAASLVDFKKAILDSGFEFEPSDASD